MGTTPPNLKIQMHERLMNLAILNIFFARQCYHRQDPKTNDKLEENDLQKMSQIKG